MYLFFVILVYSTYLGTLHVFLDHFSKRSAKIFGGRVLEIPQVVRPAARGPPPPPSLRHAAIGNLEVRRSYTSMFAFYLGNE
jgi:hypothetical protein